MVASGVDMLWSLHFVSVMFVDIILILLASQFQAVFPVPSSAFRRHRADDPWAMGLMPARIGEGKGGG